MRVLGGGGKSLYWLMDPQDIPLTGLTVSDTAGEILVMPNELDLWFAYLVFLQRRRDPNHNWVWVFLACLGFRYRL